METYLFSFVFNNMNIEVSALLPLVNQVFDLEKKAKRLADGQKLNRNLRRIKETLETVGLQIHDPLGEPFNETRTDCDASISGTHSDNLFITEVLKPIVHQNIDGFLQLIQPGVVVVSGK